jgi:hypothetical protein
MNLTSQGPLFVRVTVPQGLDAALEGLAREVLKQQPRDIYWFAAQHFETLARLRDIGGKSRQPSDRSRIECSPQALTKRDVMETAPCLVNVGTSGSAPDPLPRYLLGRWLDKPQSRSGRCGKNINSFSPSGIESWFLGRSFHSLVTSELFPFPFGVYACWRVCNEYIFAWKSLWYS